VATILPVEPTLERILVEGKQGDVIDDQMDDSDGEDSELDVSVQIVLERLDFDKENGIEDVLE
jgi:hypothetical protein